MAIVFKPRISVQFEIDGTEPHEILATMKLLERDLELALARTAKEWLKKVADLDMGPVVDGLGNKMKDETK